MPLDAVSPSVLHLDADAFFASVEQRDDPKLRGRPVAVGSGVVASCSYEARRWGVRTGMRLGEARHLCRRLLIFPGNYRRYEQAARSILAICQDQTPIVEVAALDDLYIELAPDKEPGPIAGPALDVKSADDWTGSMSSKCARWPLCRCRLCARCSAIKERSCAIKPTASTHAPSNLINLPNP
jgi:nucleotidyltransferase/DNA polymerase involved in DNA repair